MNSSTHHAKRLKDLLLCASVAGVVGLAGCSADGGSLSGVDDTSTGETRSGLGHLADSEAFMAELRLALIQQSTDFGVSDQIDGALEGDDLAAGDAAAEGSPSESVDDVSGTTVQEAGVDEQDRVKSDGERMYVLDTQFFSIVGPGVAIDEALPGSNNNSSATTLRVLDMDRDTPDAIPVADIDVDLGGREADGFYLVGDDESRAAIVTAGGFSGYGVWDTPFYFGNGDTFIARVPVADPASANVIASLQMDGQTVSSRRIDNRLIVATRYYPTINGAHPALDDAATWSAAVEAASDEDLLPTWMDAAGTRQPLVDPASCFVADRPSGGFYSPDIITLSVIDLDTLRPIDSECFLGSTETLYASPDAVFLATTRWDYSSGPTTEEAQPIDPSEALIATDAIVDSRVNTDIHRFDLTLAGLDYVASGTVTGHLGWNPDRMPYRLSEHNGDLRVATMPSALSDDVSPIIVTVLRDNGAGQLERIAELPNASRPEHIGKPLERLYASRFVGNRAYLVTFRQTDPLYVVDLSRPEDPEVLGELEITGYSEWLLPIGENHLLGLGKEAVPASEGLGDGRGGIDQGIKLSLFDVSDPRAPTEISSQRIGERGTESIALYNPRAISVQPATDQHPTRVALGIDVHGSAVAPALESITDPWDYKFWSYTGLHGFDVTTGADARIESRGALIVETARDGEFSVGPERGDDRSVLAGDAVFYVHGDHVHTAVWSDLASGSEGR